jgi:hypothetical protein
MLVTLATIGMRVLTWQPVQATAGVISTPSPVPDADALAARLECSEAGDEVELDDCGFRAAQAASRATLVAATSACSAGSMGDPMGANCSAATYSLAYSEQAVRAADPSTASNPRDPCGC